MKQKPDRRSQRTRSALRAAFAELVLARGYAAVTIGEISDKANIGRSTFYSHYKGKRDLLEESLQTPSVGLANCVAASATPQGLIPLLDHFSQQKSVNRVFLESPIRGIWVKTLARMIETRLPRNARSTPGLTALLIAELQIALIVHWLTGKFALSTEAVATMFITQTRALLANQ